jgi:hypothetical protein
MMMEVILREPGIGSGSWWRNRLWKTDHRLRRWLRGGRVIVGDALESAVVQLATLVSGESSALVFFAHFVFDRIGILNFGIRV